MGGRGGGRAAATRDRRMRRQGTRPFTYRWNRDAPFPGRGRFSRTRGDGRRTRTEASSASAAGKPLPKTAAGEGLKRRLRHGASPISDPRMSPAVAAAETRERGRERRRRRQLRRRASLTASGRSAEGGGRRADRGRAGRDVRGRAGRGGGVACAPRGRGYPRPQAAGSGAAGCRNALLLPNSGPGLGCERPGAGLREASGAPQSGEGLWEG